ncbi:MAG: spermidine synthase [Actinomycetota bacterium]|jgi:spermidine synthase|nr:spermidine synthase [Euzebyaceae bacterium]MDQ3452476.1 spermidine synthase [Actinomycetota bacterium]
MAIVLDRRITPRGEVVLRREGAALQVIANGVFLMSTAGGGASERLLVRAALRGLRAPMHVLIGGLGAGFSLVEAVRHPAVRRVTVVEVEKAIIDWHRTYFRQVTAAAIDDPRVKVVHADLVDWLDDAAGTVDAVCLDADNGPDWTVVPRNAQLYGDAGLRTLSSVITPDGALSVWSAAAAEEFEQRLRRHFGVVEIHTVVVQRGEPDHVYVARRSHGNCM